MCRISSYITSAFRSDEYLNSMICRVGVPLKVMSLVKIPVDRSKVPPMIRIMSGLQAGGRESKGTRV